MKNHQQNIFTQYLDDLKVEHTKFSDEYYKRHVNNNNLYGLSQMLSAYNIENVALQIERNTTALKNLPTPFIAQTNEYFGIVQKISDNSIDYYLEGKKIKIPYDDFIKSWTGIVLIGETNTNSIEPNYKINLSNQRKLQLKAVILYLGILSILIYGYYNLIISHNIGLAISLSLNIFSLYISYLIYSNAFGNKNAEKLCTFFNTKSNCDNSHINNPTHLFGIFSLSEIGLGYFISNIIVILQYPILYSYSALFSILSLPFTFWSIWYQKYMDKKWCILCLITQISLWTIFINNLTFNLISIPEVNIHNISIILITYIIPTTSISILSLYIYKFEEYSKNYYKTNQFRSDNYIFEQLLKREIKYNINNSIGIIFGNTNAKNTITVISNPYCAPCAEIHKQLIQLLQETNNGYKIQYLLKSFSDELEKSSIYLFAKYKTTTQSEFEILLSDWYNNQKDIQHKLLKSLSIETIDNGITNSFLYQKEWIKNAKIKKTPTILFNGTQLPEKYSVLDLKYFYDLDL